MFHNRKSDFTAADDKPETRPKVRITFSDKQKAAILAAVALYPGAPPSAVKVMSVLATRHNQEEGRCYPSTEGLAEDTGLGRQAVSKAISWLKGKGFITVTTTRRGDGLDRNSYTPRLNKAIFTLTDLTSEKRKAAGGDLPARQPRRRKATRDAPRCRREATGGVAFCTDPVSPQSDSNKGEGDIGEYNKEEAASNARVFHSMPDRAEPKPAKVPLPADLAFPADAIAAAHARGLDDGDMAAALSTFRAKVLADNPNDRRTMSVWIKGAVGWLQRQEPRPKGTAPRIAPQRPADPHDVDGELFQGLDGSDERLRKLAMDMPDKIFQKVHPAWLARYSEGGEAADSLSNDWNGHWLRSMQYEWDLEKMSRPESKFAPPRPGI